MDLVAFKAKRGRLQTHQGVIQKMQIISVQIQIIPPWIGLQLLVFGEKKKVSSQICFACVSAVVTVVRLFTSHRSTTMPWSQPAWTTTPGRWSPVWTTCWPKLWRNTESCPGGNITDLWYLHHGGLETDTLTKVDDFGVPRRQRAFASSGAFSITFYSPSGKLHSWLWREWLQKLRRCER